MKMSECEAGAAEVYVGDSDKIKCVCHLCNLSFFNQGNLNRHLRKIHELQVIVQKANLTCALCQEKFRTMRLLLEHIQKQHSITLKFGAETFYSEKDFLDWKNKIEKESVSSFIKQNSSHAADGISNANYVCHRSGRYEMKQNRFRRVKSRGSIKTGSTCPAYMKVSSRTIDGISEIKVRYQSVHVGHDLETRTLTLKKKERERLASCSKLGISMDKILDEARQNCSPMNRYNKLTRKMLHNIRSDYGIPKNYNKPQENECEVVAAEVFVGDSDKIKCVCHLCNVSFINRGNLNRHLKKFHRLQVILQKANLTCALCQEKFRTMLLLIEHIQSQHAITLKFSEETFYSEKEFLDWKNKIEKESVSSYIKQKSSHTADGISNANYVCHRSGRYKMKQSRFRRVKSLGSIKTGNTCPAYMKVSSRTIDGILEIKVQYQSVHVGHDLDTTTLTLKKEERERLAACLKLGISMDKILDEARQNCSPTNRYSNITRKMLHNIRSYYGIPKNYDKPCKTSAPQKSEAETSDCSIIGFEDYVEIEVSNHVEIQEHEINTAVFSLLLLQNPNYSEEFNNRKMKIINQLKELQSRIEEWDPQSPLPDVEEHIRAFNANLDICSPSNRE